LHWDKLDSQNNIQDMATIYPKHMIWMLVTKVIVFT